MIPEISPYNNYIGDGATTQFDFDFYIENSSQLRVEHINTQGIATILTENIDYTINEIGNNNGSYINFPHTGSSYDILRADEVISLQLTLPISQESEYGKSSELDFKSLEYSLDYLTRICQIISRGLERSVKVQEGSGTNADEFFQEFKDDVKNTVENAKNNIDNSMLEFKSEVNTNINNQIYANKIDTDRQIQDFKDEVNSTIDEVNEAASKINAMDEAVETCVNKAGETLNNTQIAIEQAEIATQKAQECIDTFNSKTDINLSNLSTIGKNILNNKLNKSHLTNCITEIPKRIKLELNNGVLTLKAGSILTIPNGFEADRVTPKFDYLEIESDMTTSQWGTGSAENIPVFVGNTLSNPFLGPFVDTVVSAGPTPIISGNINLWYDTVNNIIKFSDDGGVNWRVYGYAFPVALINYINGYPNTINQIFNGFGFMGTTLWCDKGVKALIPNGRNADGTLKNIEVTTPRCSIAISDDRNRDVAIFINRLGFIEMWGMETHVQWYNERPKVAPDIYCTAYIASENKWIRSLDTVSWATELPFVYVSSYRTNNNSQIISFNQPNTVDILKRSDIKELSKISMPSSKNIDLTLGVSGTYYVAPANGYYFLRKFTNLNNSFIEFINVSSLLVNTHFSYTTQDIQDAIIMPAKKGDIVYCNYTFNGTTTMFKFIYAEGER